MFSHEIGNKVKINSFLSQFDEFIGVIEDRWVSQRSGKVKYGVNLGGCILVQIFEEDELIRYE